MLHARGGQGRRHGQRKGGRRAAALKNDSDRIAQGLVSVCRGAVRVCEVNRARSGDKRAGTKQTQADSALLWVPHALRCVPVVRLSAAPTTRHARQSQGPVLTFDVRVRLDCG
jgi:hypothetical protein